MHFVQATHLCPSPTFLFLYFFSCFTTLHRYSSLCCVFFFFFSFVVSMRLPCSQTVIPPRHQHPMHLNVMLPSFHLQQFHLLSNTAFCHSYIFHQIFDFHKQIKLIKIHFPHTTNLRRLNVFNLFSLFDFVRRFLIYFTEHRSML